MRRCKLETQPWTPTTGSNGLPPTGLDAGLQPTPPQTSRVRSGWNLLLLLLCGSLLASCLSTLPDIDKLQSHAEDRKQAPYPPTAAELARERPFVAVIGTPTGEDVSTYAKENSVLFLKSMLEESGNLQIFPDFRLQQVLDTKEYRMLDMNREEDVIRLGEAVRVKYVALVEPTAPNFPHKENDWSATVTMKLYQLSPMKKLAEETFPFQQSRLDELRLDLAPALEAALPLQAFVMETYEKRKVARLNAGLAQGVGEKDRFAVFRRVKQTEVGGSDTMRITTRTEAYSKQVGTLEIFRAKENEAWALLEPAEGEEILQGDAAFRFVRYRTDMFRTVGLGAFE